MGRMKEIWQQMKEENWQGSPEKYLSQWIKNNPDKLFKGSKEKWEEIEKEEYIRRCAEEHFLAQPSDKENKYNQSQDDVSDEDEDTEEKDKNL